MMVTTSAELAAQLVATQAFIEADYFDVVLKHRTKVPNGSGGYTFVMQDHPTAQRLRLIPLQDVKVQRSTADGAMVVPEYALLGLPNADIRRWDQFTRNGRTYEIVYVNDNVPYQRKAEVVYRG